MALTSIKFAPGVDKQDTAVGAIGRWVDSDNVRWRYGLPEKVIYCKKCVISNQRPSSVVEFKNSNNKMKLKITV